MRSVIAGVGFRGWVVAISLVGFVLAGGAWADEPIADPELAALLPGKMLADEELAEIHGKGSSITIGGELSFDEVPFQKPPNLRKSIMGALKSAGVRPSLNPAGPNGIAGGGAIPLPKMPRMTISIPTPEISMGASAGGSSSNMSGSGF